VTGWTDPVVGTAEGVTLGPIRVLRTDQWLIPGTYEHEAEHSAQFYALGPLFVPAYLLFPSFFENDACDVSGETKAGTCHH
jgi:hypothetical protein